MLFNNMYHGNLYSDLWKSGLYFRPAEKNYIIAKEPNVLNMALHFSRRQK